MKKCTILYLPLDERPCNAEFVCKIARGTPVEVVCPGAEILGDKKKPADFGKVRKFLVDNRGKSRRMRDFGGHVAVRRHSAVAPARNDRSTTYGTPAGAFRTQKNQYVCKNLRIFAYYAVSVLQQRR